MKKEEDKLEKTFREKLDDYKVPVAASAWAGIESALGNVTTSVAGSISTLFYAAAIVGSVVFTTAIVSHNSNKEKQSVEKVAERNENPSEQNGFISENNESEQLSEQSEQPIETENNLLNEEENIDNDKTKKVNSTDLSTRIRERYLIRETPNINNEKESVVVVEKVPENKLYTKISSSVSGGYAPLRVSFEHESSPDTKTRWNFGDKSESYTSRPIHTYTRPGNYKVSILITDKYGNTAVDNMYIEVKEGSSIGNVSSIITPNNDDRNDEVTFSHKNITEFNMRILNSSSKEVFQSNNIEKLWKGYDEKGRVHPNGSYFYVIKAKGVDGKEYELKGVVSLLENYRP